MIRPHPDAFPSPRTRRAVGIGPLDREGLVEFAARYAAGSGRGVLHETSRFVREDRWRYVDAID